MTILGIIETVLSHNDRHLVEHFVKVNVTTQVRIIVDIISSFSILLTPTFNMIRVGRVQAALAVWLPTAQLAQDVCHVKEISENVRVIS